MTEKTAIDAAEAPSPPNTASSPPPDTNAASTSALPGDPGMPEPVITVADTSQQEAPPPDHEPPEPEYPAESEDRAPDDGAKVWLRQNIHWLLRELDLIKEGHSEADREKLNP